MFFEGRIHGQIDEITRIVALIEHAAIGEALDHVFEKLAVSILMHPAGRFRFQSFPLRVPLQPQVADLFAADERAGGPGRGPDQGKAEQQQDPAFGTKRHQDFFEIHLGDQEPG